MTSFFKSKIIPELDINILQNNIFPAIGNSVCGDLFLEKENSFIILMENGKVIKNIQNSLKGFSIRKYINNIMYLLSSSDLNINKIIEYSKKISNNKEDFNYKEINFLNTKNFLEKYHFNFNYTEELKLLIGKINNYIFSKKHVSNLIINFNYVKNHREIYNEKFEVVEKIHILFTLRFNLTLKKDDKYEVFYRAISNQDYEYILKNWQKIADELWEDGYSLLNGKTINAGIYTILCAPGDAGTILHEAVGHALETDALFTNTSCFSNEQNKKIANDCVTVVDDGTVEDARGTIEYDDEGTRAQKNILIKNGIFVGEMNNKIYAYKSNQKPSGNGRREHFDCEVIPRMTNTYLEAGKEDADLMLKNIKNGIFVKFIGGGQVNTSVGSFVFEGKIAYLIENGKLTSSLKEVMLMGNCKDILNNIIAVSKDMSLCHSGGYCGKDGQQVPVTVGGPYFVINNVTVGGK